MKLPYDEVCQNGLELQGQAEERQQASLRGSIAVVGLASLVTTARGMFLHLRLNCLSFSISVILAKSFRSFKRLPGLFPRSIIAASLVALRIFFSGWHLGRNGR